MPQLPPWPTAIHSKAERRQAINSICLNLKVVLGLQDDSSLNQAEHVSALWESFIRRHRTPLEALEDLWNQLLRTQGEWWTDVWQEFTASCPTWEALTCNPLLDVCLFLLLWGELGNLRFCPELGCFLFAAARSYCTSPSMESKPEGAFLNDVVKPIFKVMMNETYAEPEPGGAPKFKYGKAPAPANACNYDDWNELFWDSRRLRRLTLKDSTHLRYPAATQVWTILPDVDWELTLKNKKTHRECHCFLSLLVGHYRPFLMHSVSFFLMLLIWSKQSVGWQQRSAVGLIAPAWLTFYEIGYQALTPTISCCNRLRGLLKLFFFYWLPVFSFTLVFLMVDGVYIQVDSGSAMFGIILGVHFFLSIWLFVVALKPRYHGLYNSRFQPKLAQESVCASGVFWLLTLALKLLLDLMVTRYCASALDSIWLDRSVQKPWLVIAQLLTLIVPAALSVFASLSFFTNFVVAIFGAVRGVIQLGGFNLCWNRHSMGFTRIPEAVSRRVLQMPQERLADLDFWSARRWWNRMSDQELEAFVDVWTCMVEELRSKDLLTDFELKTLSFTTAAEARKGPPNLPHLLDPMSVLRLASALPSNNDAKRRILTLARSAQMSRLPAAMVREAPALSVLIPHYSETIMFEKKDLFNRHGSTDLLKFLVRYYRDEFQNFADRVCQSNGLQSLRRRSGSAFSDRSFEEHSEGTLSPAQQKKLEAELCKWASLRMQTLWRTVEGICQAYAHALLTISKHQEPFLLEDERETLICEKFQVVVAVQRYAKFSDPSSPSFDAHMVAMVEALLTTFGKFLCIAYIDEEDAYNEKRYYSCMIDSTCSFKPDGIGARMPRFKIELPGFPILGNGKSDNQNCAVIFTRGEILQMIDSNQEAYFEASLFLPLALHEFNTTCDGVRPGILGFREHIFSNIGLLGRLAADGEFAFGTVIQRTMDWPLQSRLHYGHPDMLDKLQMLQQGGVSKATRGLNLSEDIFAGIDLTLRGGWTKYREYFHVGKGRDMGFMSVMSFHAKVSMGNGEQATTRQWMRLGLGLPMPRLLGIFYMHVGFYLNQCLVAWSVKSFAFMVAFFTLSDEANWKFSGAAQSMCTSYFGIFYLMFLLASMLPLLLEVLLEDGFRAACKSMGSSVVALSPFFSSFQSKLMAHFFETTVNYGGAQYIPTGRGLATSREPFDKLFRCFARVAMNDGLEVALFLGISFGKYYGTTFYFCIALSIVSWTLAPFLFNPNQFHSCDLIIKDFHIWRRWMFSGNGSEDRCWATWTTNTQMVRRNASKLWIVVPSARLLTLLCTVALVLEVVPMSPFVMSIDWFRSLLPLAPPLSFPVLCFLFAWVEFCTKCNCYMFTGILAIASLVAELLLTDVNARQPCIFFLKYIWVRFLLEAADGIVSHRPGGCSLVILHRACRLWALSWRFLRDLFLGLLLMGWCIALAAAPCISKLHKLFLFRTLVNDEAHVNLLEESLGHSPSTTEELLRQFLSDPRSLDSSYDSIPGNPHMPGKPAV